MATTTQPTNPADPYADRRRERNPRARVGHALAPEAGAAAGHDVRPFAVRLNELRHIHGLTFRALAARLQACAKPGERGMTHSHLAALTIGRSRPTPQVVELVARAFEIVPEAFIEWRLWQVQQLFDPERSDGFEAAVDQLFAFLEAGAADAPVLGKPEALESRRDIFALRRRAA